MMRLIRSLLALTITAELGAACAGTAFGDGPDSGAADAAGPLADAPEPEPTPRAPCDRGQCWLNAPAVGGTCGTDTIREDFSTGLYNVHRYPLAVPAGVKVTATLEVTGGVWNPALLLLDSTGVTLSDGERAWLDPSIVIEPVKSGRGGSVARLHITAQVETNLHLFVTSWSVVDGAFSPPMPQDARYTLSVLVDCPAPQATCPIYPGSITSFGSGYFTSSDSSDPNDPNYNPYKRDSRQQHSGYDIYAPLGTDALATQNGRIISYSAVDTGACGLSVNLATDSGVTFRYCHLQAVLVTSGVVQAGQPIGRVGESGNAYSPHLHFAYLDAPNVTGAGTDAEKSPKVNQYIDGLCR